MKLFKKSISTLVIGTLLFSAGVFHPKETEAAIIIFGTAAGLTGVISSECGGNDADPDAYLFATLVFVPMSAAIASSFGATTDLILSADVNLPQSQLAESFSKKYPFIDNNETSTELAQAVRAKIPTDSKLKVGERITVSFLESETRALLQKSSLSEEQIQKVANDLK